MKITRARALLSKDISNMELEALQKHKVNLIDAIREAEGDYGMEQGVANGFFKVIASESASGYTPTDMWLAYALKYRLGETEEKLKAFTSAFFDIIDVADVMEKYGFECGCDTDKQTATIFDNGEEVKVIDYSMVLFAGIEFKSLQAFSDHIRRNGI